MARVFWRCASVRLGNGNWTVLAQFEGNWMEGLAVDHANSLELTLSILF